MINTRSHCAPGLFDKIIIVVELSTLFLLLLVFLRLAGMLLKTSIFRTEAVLEISDGKIIHDIYLATLPGCPMQYFAIMRSWVRGIRFLRNMWTMRDLEIVWSSFHITDKDKGEMIHLPHFVKLTLWQSWAVRTTG